MAYERPQGQGWRGLAPALITRRRDVRRGRHAGTPLLAAGIMLVLAAAGGCGSLVGPTQARQQSAAGVTSAHHQPATPASGPARAEFGALAGYGCPKDRQESFREAGWYANGINGFIDVPTRGWDKQGCKGTFGAMPMSGSATRPDPANFAVWTFHTAPISAGTCQTAVYVPDDASIEHAGGDPAQYEVYDSAAPSGTPAGSFAIDDLTSRGQWVSTGSYPVTKGVLTIMLSSAGKDWHGNVVTHAHLPISQVMVFCSTAAS
jgi:translation initiation factor IF-2